MMRVYRWNLMRSRVGTVAAAGLVGCGLMMTASGGIAAETSKKVEQQVRTALAPLAPPAVRAVPEVSLPPAMPKAVRAPARLDADDLPAVPVAPAAPVPPTAPIAPVAPVARVAGVAPVAAMMTVSWTRDNDDIVDSAAINREVREAVRDAQADARAAQAEARAAVRVALRSLPRVDCGNAHAVRVRDDDNPAIRCVGWSEKDKAQLRRTMITSLERARASIAAMDMRHMTDDARDSALETLDQQLEYLREHE